MPSDHDDWADCCAHTGADDGLSPQEIAQQERGLREGKRRQAGSHRHLQYVKQARWAIEASLACDIGDPRLRELTLIDVRPVTGCAVLEVIFASPAECEDVRTRLKAIEGVLRAAIAAATHRKRVASLRFCLIPAEHG